MNALAHARPLSSDPSRLLLWLGRALVTLWAAFWLWFNLASGIGEGGGASLVAHLATGLVFLALGLAAWRWRLAGGIALLAGAAGLAAFFGFYSFLVAALLYAPPVVAGLLLVAAARADRRAR